MNSLFFKRRVIALKNYLRNITFFLVILFLIIDGLLRGYLATLNLSFIQNLMISGVVFLFQLAIILFLMFLNSKKN